MTSTITTRSTKAQLLDHIKAQDAEITKRGFTIAALREKLAFVAPEPRIVFNAPGVHKAYWLYVSEQRRTCRARGQRVVSYLDFNDWVASLRNKAAAASA